MLTTSSPADVQELVAAYRTLDLELGASPVVIRNRYRELVQIYHPDKWPQGSAEQVASAERMREINGAYDLIEDAPLQYQQTRSFWLLPRAMGFVFARTSWLSNWLEMIAAVAAAFAAHDDVVGTGLQGDPSAIEKHRANRDDARVGSPRYAAASDQDRRLLDSGLRWQGGAGATAVKRSSLVAFIRGGVHPANGRRVLRLPVLSEPFLRQDRDSQRID